MGVINLRKKRNDKVQILPDFGPLKILTTKTYEINNMQRPNVESLLLNSRGETFGIEFFLSQDKNKSYYFTSEENNQEDKKTTIPMLFSTDKKDLKEMDLYYIQSEKSMFFPFLLDSNQYLWDKIKDRIKPQIKNSRVFLQFVLQKRNDEKWKNKMEEQYQQYLKGIDEPSNISLIQKIQDKINEKYPEEWKVEKEEVEEIKQKIESEAFKVCIRLVILDKESKNRERISKEILKVFKICTDNYNTWGISKVVSFRKESFVQNLQFRRFPIISATTQTLSKEEVLPFLVFQKEQLDEPIIPTNKENKKLLGKGVLSEKLPLLKLLPNGKELTEQVFNPSLIEKLNKALEKIGVVQEGEQLEFKEVKNGPTLQKVTLSTPKGLKLSKIQNNAKDIQSELGLQNLSFEQGMFAGSVAMRLPRENRQIVFLRDMVDTKTFEKYSQEKILPFLIGMSDTGEPVYECLTRVKHLLVAGATGSGKSVWLNQLLLMLLLTKSPEEMKMYLIDPKMVEFPAFKAFPQVEEVLTEANEANDLLRNLTIEMDERYKKLNSIRCRNIQQYNKKVKKNERMPYIVTVVDEFADLIMLEPDIEDHIVRLAQKARACGIHLIIATQRPSVDVITGLIKSNLPSRICFSCSSVNDYRTVLSHQPPYVLLGKGDGVAQLEGKTDFIRFQGVLIANDEEETDEILIELSEKLNEKWGQVKSLSLLEKNNEVKEVEKEAKDTIEPLDKLKTIIAETGETRIRNLQRLLKIRMNTITEELLPKLVEEGWLEAPNEISRSYKLLISEEDRKLYLEEQKK